MEQEIESLVQSFADIIDYSLNVDVTMVNDSAYKIDLSGENLSLLIGFHGKNIESIEHILNLFLRKNIKNNLAEFKFHIDINGYRKHREVEITKLLESIIKKMTGKPSSYRLNPMPPYERLFVHEYVKKFDKISSRSEGEGSDRFVTLIAES